MDIVGMSLAPVVVRLHLVFTVVQFMMVFAVEMDPGVVRRAPDVDLHQLKEEMMRVIILHVFHQMGRQQLRIWVANLI